MADDDELLEYLVLWEEAEAQGDPVSAQAVCPDRPDLWEALTSLKRQLADVNRFLSTAQYLLQPAGDDTDPDVDSAASRAGRPDVPGYEILEELGRGGMGIVCRARHLGLNRIVALKMILAGADEKRFRTEGEAMARLKHDNVVQVYEVGRHQGRAFFCMEYVDGPNLGEVIQSRDFSQREAAELLAQLSRAVHAAHQLGIVHRDLKPSNILLGPAGSPKLTDFGLAKLLDRDASLTAAGDIIGTPLYMAPEQATGDTASIGVQTDVYALGAILYRLLAGRPPFESDSSRETLRKIVSQQPEPPGRVRPVDADLEAICLKCLEKEPALRYGNAEELSNDLTRWMRNEPVHARRQTMGYRLSRFLRRHRRWMSWAIGAAAIAAAVGLAWAAVAELRRGSVRAAAGDLVERSDKYLADGDETNALEALREARTLVEDFEQLCELRREVDQRISRLSRRVEVRSKLARFQRLNSRIFSSVPATYRDAETCSRVIEQCETAVGPFGVLDRADWLDEIPPGALSTEQRHALRTDVAALLGLYLDVQHHCRIRGAEICGLGFQIEKGARPGRVLLPRLTVVDGGSVAERAGLRTDDRLLEINGTPSTEFAHRDDVHRALYSKPSASLLVLHRNARSAERIQIVRPSPTIGFGIKFVRTKQLQVGAVDSQSQAWSAGIQTGHVLLSVNGRPASGAFRTEDGLPTSQPFVASHELLAVGMKRTMDLVLLDPQNLTPRSVRLTWGPEKTQRVRRTSMLHLQRTIRSTWGGFEAAKASGDPDFMNDWSVARRDEATETSVERHYTEKWLHPRDLVKAAILAVVDGSPAFIRATRLQAEGNHSEAIREYERALAANPADVQSLKLLARCYAVQSQWDKAAAVMDRLLAVRPATYIEFIERGGYCLNGSRPGDAERDARAALEDIRQAEALGEPAGLATARKQAESLLARVRATRTAP